MKTQALALAAVCCIANGQESLPVLPKNAYTHMPVVIKSIDDLWPDLSMRSFIPSLIEQETCISLKHSKCWSTVAELKTAREYGFGLGQTTVAYYPDGRERFNVWRELRQKHPELRDWTWENRFSPEMQIKAIILKNRYNWGTLSFPIATERDKYAFLAVTYNGGSTFRDRQICKSIRSCDSSKWFGNVELYSVKSKIPAKGYKLSFFEISRKYPVNVLDVRRPKYIPYVER